ncbi:hypothetical protein GCM10007198_06140 [Microbacterium aerolatum]|nr:hypothetical protein GCM10007198_06140 [Microbacterium aerolatum]
MKLNAVRRVNCADPDDLRRCNGNINTRTPTNPETSGTTYSQSPRTHSRGIGEDTAEYAVFPLKPTSSPPTSAMPDPIKVKARTLHERPTAPRGGRTLAHSMAKTNPITGAIVATNISTPSTVSFD